MNVDHHPVIPSSATYIIVCVIYLFLYVDSFDYAMEQIGGPLSDDAEPTFAKGLGGDDGVSGLQNGYREGPSSWRLDYDPDKGVHFNWMLGKRTDDLYGAASFPGTYDTYTNMLLGLAEGGVEMMVKAGMR